MIAALIVATVLAGAPRSITVSTPHGDQRIPVRSDRGGVPLVSAPLLVAALGGTFTVGETWAQVTLAQQGFRFLLGAPLYLFNDQLEAAIAFYTSTFPDSEIKNVARTGKDGPITSAEFVVGGQSFMGYNGGPYFKFSEGFSLFVDCKDQEEVDEYWNKLISAGATPSQCGWITDQFGITWQIVPRRFMELISDKNQKKVQAVMEAMMKMVKLDVATLERAYDEAYQTKAALAG